MCVSVLLELNLVLKNILLTYTTLKKFKVDKIC